MKNIEKMAQKIAQIIAEDTEYSCRIFAKKPEDNECDTCLLAGCKCFDEKALLEFFLTDAEEYRHDGYGKKEVEI